MKEQMKNSNNSLQIYRTVLGKFVMVDYIYKVCMRGKNNLQVLLFGYL